MVTSLSDLDRAGTLRYEIEQANLHANTGGNPDEIVFKPSLSGKILLTSDLPAITEALAITGNGISHLVIDGVNKHRLITITGSAQNVTIQDLTLQYGSAAEGGAVYIDDAGGTVTVSSVLITNNTAHGSAPATPDDTAGPATGGGIHVQSGHLMLLSSAVFSNVAKASAGADALGGGIYIGTAGDASISQSTINKNSAIAGDGTDGAIGDPGDAGGNGDPGQDGDSGGDGGDGSAAGSGGAAHGGGIYSAGGLLTITASKVSANLAHGGDGGKGGAGGRGGAGGKGGPAFTDDDGVRNPPGAGGDGGGGGSGGAGGDGGDASGGGIETHGSLTIDSTTISSNTAEAGHAGRGGGRGVNGLNRSGVPTASLGGSPGDPGMAGSAAGGGIASYASSAPGTDAVMITSSNLLTNHVTGGDGVNGFSGRAGTPGAAGTPDDGDGSDGDDGEDGTDGVAGGSARGGGIYSEVKLSLVHSTVSGNTIDGGAGGAAGSGGAGGHGGAGAAAFNDPDLGPTPAGLGGLGGMGGAGANGGDGGDAIGAGISAVASLTFTNSTASENIARAGTGGAAGHDGKAGAAGHGRARSPDDADTAGVSAVAADDGDGPQKGANGASAGGGVSVEGNLLVLQSTFASNRAAQGGGINVSGGTSKIENSTIALNTAKMGGGVFVAPTATLTAISSIIANNSGGTTANRDVTGAINATYCLIRYRALNTLGTDTTHDIVLVDPGLLPLKAFGANPAVMVLKVGSAAIDKGSNPENLTTDERGVGHARMLSTAVDIGAVELK